jgi:hypothetical protein
MRLSLLLRPPPSPPPPPLLLLLLLLPRGTLRSHVASQASLAHPSWSVQQNASGRVEADPRQGLCLGGGPA